MIHYTNERRTGQNATVTTVHPLVERARALQPLVRERAAAAEKAIAPDADVVRAMADAGLYAMCVPGLLGGAEADPLTTIATIDAIAQADGAAGWVLMIGAETTGIGSAYLPPDTGRTLVLDHPSVVICGALNPVVGREMRVVDRIAVCVRRHGATPFFVGNPAALQAVHPSASTKALV